MPRKSVLLMVGGIAVVLVIILVICAVIPDSNTSTASQPLSEGVQYLESLEEKDPAQVDQLIKLRRQQRLQAMKDELQQQINTGKVSVWTLFDDYVLFGDSRSVGFTYYGFLPDTNVWAETGATISHLQGLLPDLYDASPSYVYLTYGMNDFCSGLYNQPEQFTTEYRAVIEDIQKNLPDATIVVCSILPASEAAYQRANIWSVIPNYNEAIREMCDGLDRCYFVDCDGIAEEHMDLWEADGVHFQKEFYPYWATAMIMEVYNHELFADDSDDESVAA